MMGEIANLIMLGGVYYDILGGTCRDIMANVIEKIQDKIIAEKKDMLLQAVMEREALVSTGMENGIALPHPRIPLLGDDEKPFVTIAFPASIPEDWETLDNSKINTIFLIVSKSPKQHLDVMSKISFLCQQEKFKKLIFARASKNKIIEAIKEAESAW
jgi:PTS system nitrogen regulatory IIA component